MASSKLPTKGVVSFLELRKRCPKDQLHLLDKLYAKNQQYHERLRTLRKGLPLIDWDYYKRNVRTESVAMVEEFEKKYSSFSVPYPEDKYTKQIDKMKTELKAEIAEFKKESNNRIAVYEKEIDRIRNMLPFDQMTWEDYCILYPESAPDFINKPTFWPHTEDEQIEEVADVELEEKEKEINKK